MRIVIDTNALFGDPVLVREVSAKVLGLLVPARATLVFSPVVVGELNRRRSDDIEDLRETIHSRARKLAGLAGVDASALVAELKAMTKAADERWAARWREILAHENVELGEWPTTDSQQLAERELGRRRPFIEKEAGTIGHRDTLIWLGVVELATEDPTDEIIFVTADKGFLAGDALHSHLIDDLEAVGARDSVTSVSSMHGLAEKLQRATETSGWEAWREPRIAALLYDEIQSLGAGDFSEAWDRREGGLSEPTFDVGLPYTEHEWQLDSAEGPQDLEIEDAEFGAAGLDCSFVVDIHLSGFMDKVDWYSDDHPEVDLWDADWNDHVVSIEASRSVRIRARFEIDDHNETAHFDKFLGSELVSDLGTITIL